MKKWEHIKRPVDVEADIPLIAQAPADVIAKYYTHDKNSFIAWVDESGQIMGCIKNNRSISFLAKDAAIILLSEMKVAKGDGWVGLTINTDEGNCLATISSSRHSQKSLEWLKSIQPQLANIFGLKEAYEDLGYDA